MGRTYNLLLQTCFVLLGLLYCDSVEKQQLLYVQILFRHGDRAPINLYPNDPNPESFWPEGLARLTQLGKRQHYKFGEFLRKNYEDFISSNPLEVDVVSSDVDRCIKSAEVNIASFFAPNEKWKFLPSVNWQPLAIHYLPKSSDMYLETDSDCPMAQKELQRIIASEEGQKFISEHAEMFRNLTFYSGTPITNWISASYLHDVLFVEKKYNLTTPSWALDFWDELNNVSDLSFYWSFNSPLMLRLRAGPLIGLMVDNMQKKLSGKTANKIHIFSAHDTNVAVLLHALNVFNMKQPPYCAAVVVELYKSGEGPTVRLLYFNSSTPEEGEQPTNILVLPGCTEYCPFIYFLNYTKELIPTNWKEECSLKENYFKFSPFGLITICILSAVTFTVMVLVYFVLARVCNKRESEQEYSYQLMSTS